MFMSDSGHSSEYWGQICRVAKYHRWVIVSIAIQLGFGIVGVNCFVSEGMRDAFLTVNSNPIVTWVSFAINVFAIVAMVLLARELTNTVVAVFLGIVATVPLSSYLLFPMLVVIHILAARWLKQQGFKVGLFGVNPELS